MYENIRVPPPPPPGFHVSKGNYTIVINLRVSAHACKNFHVSIKGLHICANDPALEDFVIQNNSECFAPCAKTPGMEYVY